MLLGENTTLKRKLTKIQETFIKNEGGQCGFCIPGIIMSTTALFHECANEKKGIPSNVDIEEMLAGHTCRCTGYRPQVQALKELLVEAQKEKIVEPIKFPEELQPMAAETIIVEGDGFNFYVPASYDEFIKECSKYPKAHIVGGCTHSLQLLHDYSYVVSEVSDKSKINIISTMRVSEFQKITKDEHNLNIGASVSVEELIDLSKEYSKENPNECNTLTTIAHLLPRLRSKQIRGVSTVCGEIGAYSEIGALLLSLGAKLNIVQINEEGKVANCSRIPLTTPCSCGCGSSLSGTSSEPNSYISTSLCTVDCALKMKENQIITSVDIPLHNNNNNECKEFCNAHIVSRRLDNFTILMMSTIFGKIKKEGEKWKFIDGVVCITDGRGHLDRESRKNEGEEKEKSSAKSISEAEQTNPALRRQPYRPICVVHKLPNTSSLFSSTSSWLEGEFVRNAMCEMRKEIETIMSMSNASSSAEEDYKKACDNLTLTKPPMPTSLLAKRYVICTSPSLLARFAAELGKSVGVTVALSSSSSCSSSSSESSSSASSQPLEVPPSLTNFDGKLLKYECKFDKVDTIIGSSHSNMHLPSHVTGMTKYTTDIPLPHNGVHASFILSTIAHGKILSIDGSEALAVPGVVDVVTAKDIPGVNKHTGIFMDTKIFADEMVDCMHQPLGVVVATTPEIAEYAAKNKVKVKYEELPPILTMEEGYEKKSFLDQYENRFVELGDIDGTIAKAKERTEHRKQREEKIKEGKELSEEEKKEQAEDEEEGELIVIEGEAKCGGQDHYYGETQNAVVFPLDDTVEVYSSTQNPSKVQFDVAGALGIPRAKVTCRAMKLGGGYGGKQDRPCIFATAAAVAAYKTGRPVKLVMHRSEDMKVHGGRHPIWLRYTAVVQKKKEHKIVGLLMENICQGGYAHDVTGPVLFKCTFQIQGPYTIPNMRSIARAVKTNHNPNTAFRGFGAPQSCAFIEFVFDHIADVLGVDPMKLREVHLNKEGEELLTGSLVSQKKGEKFIRIMWNELLKTADYEARVKAVEEFNVTHKEVKRGIAITPMKNGCCFEDDFMNQAEALVHILPDGSVEVAHSGIEMGQGLNTKIAQCAAETLGIDMKYIHVFHTSTETCANTQPTAASTGLDLNGGAVIMACKKINEQLKPFKEKHPDLSWEDFCSEAYFSRQNMSGQAHFILPTINWNWENKTGYTAFYYAFGVSVSEVEIDVATGEYRILRSDLIEDAGRPMNPTLDLGQVEGGFIQGVGWLTGEEIEYDVATGSMISDMDTYAVPLIRDIPLELHTTLGSNFTCPPNVGQSKTTAESPVLLGVSVLMALRHAVDAARRDRGLPKMRFQQTPFTVDRIKLAVEGELDKVDCMKYTEKV